jgi:hypothetical protein
MGRYSVVPAMGILAGLARVYIGYSLVPAMGILAGWGLVYIGYSVVPVWGIPVWIDIVIM